MLFFSIAVEEYCMMLCKGVGQWWNGKSPYSVAQPCIDCLPDIPLLVKAVTPLSVGAGIRMTPAVFAEMNKGK